MDLEAILCIQHQRRVTNDYTIRFQNRLYQILPPPWPGLRGGRVIVEQRLDGRLHLRFKDHYLSYEVLGEAKAGALPPTPRSLTRRQTPAEAGNGKGSAGRKAEPCAVSLTSGRSGRTPAEPCPAGDEESLPRKPPYRPAPDHPWRKSYKLMTGHF
jgi:hypothetical protein